MKKILVPCDFSPNSIEAFKVAINIAAANKARVEVLHIIEFPAYFVGTFDVPIQTYDPSVMFEFDRVAVKNFKKLKSSYARKNDKVKFHIVHGAIIHSIREYITSKKIDLVIMGTKGASGLKEFFIGSNTEKIVRTSSVPVISVRNATQLSSVKNIIFPTNLDPAQTSVIRKVKELQRFFKARLHILMINTPEIFQPDYDLRTKLEKYAKQNKFENFTLNIRGDVSESDGIGHFAMELNGGMIAMATHGRTGLMHLFSGSVAEDVVNHYNCLIWTCHSKSRK